MLLFRKAIQEADAVRMQLGFDMFQPVNIYDICISLGITVRFVDINMEGMYASGADSSQPTIVLSNKRPFARRFFTCAHELGHHRFRHGDRIDVLDDHDFVSNEKEEISADAFAAALLMPVAGIQAEFAKRSIDIGSATSLHYYTVASSFGVGYQTLVINSRIQSLISVSREKELLKHTPAKIFKQVTGLSHKPSHFKILDDFSELTVIDMEVSSHLILPKSGKVEGTHLKELLRDGVNTVFVAIKPGVTRCSFGGKSCFIRIQRAEYIGLSENRHLES